MTEISVKNLELQRKIIKAINEEIGSDIKQLSKLKSLYDETQAIYCVLKEKVGFQLMSLFIEHLTVNRFVRSMKQRHRQRCKRRCKM